MENVSCAPATQLRHEQHEELLHWNGPFDPEALDPKKATREMRKVMKHMSAEE